MASSVPVISNMRSRFLLITGPLLFTAVVDFWVQHLKACGLEGLAIVLDIPNAVFGVAVFLMLGGPTLIAQGVVHIVFLAAVYFAAIYFLRIPITRPVVAGVVIGTAVSVVVSVVVIYSGTNRLDPCNRLF